MKNTFNSKFSAVILAGGSGERFWPLSTPARPKQFLDYFGGQSLIRQTVSRLDGFVRSEDMFILTTKELRSATVRELRELPSSNIVGEPMCRDTLAAIALGVGASGKNGDSVIGFFPSDHLVNQNTKFRAALRKAVSLAKNKNCIVTIGVKPSCASTAFGYIDPASGRFFEKPDKLSAGRYIDAGFLWNAGMFFARAGVFRALFEKYAPAVLPLSQGKVGRRGLSAFYSSLAKISFDYAVMEKLSQRSAAKRGDTVLEVVPGDFLWDDVGGYGAFDKYFPHDENGNVRDGECTAVESESNICIARGAKISLLGVKNLIVVSTADSVLVADKSRAEELKKLFKRDRQ